MTPWQKYQHDLKRDDFQYDAAQENAVKHLQRLYDDLLAASEYKPTWLDRLLGKDSMPKVKGLYFWGAWGVVRPI